MSLDDAIAAIGGVVVETASRDRVFVLDRFCQHSAEVDRNECSEPLSGELEAKVRSLNLAAEAKVQTQSATLICHVLVEDIFASSTLRTGVQYLLASLSGNCDIELRVHFNDKPPTWDPLLRWLHHLWNSFDSLAGKITLTGPFPEIDETAADVLCGLGCTLEFVVGFLMI